MLLDPDPINLNVYVTVNVNLNVYVTVNVYLNVTQCYGCGSVAEHPQSLTSDFLTDRSVCARNRNISASVA